LETGEPAKTFGPYTIIDVTEETPQQFGAGDCGVYTLAMVEAFIRYANEGGVGWPTFAHCCHNILRGWRMRYGRWACGPQTPSEIARDYAAGKHAPPAQQCSSTKECFTQARGWYAGGT
jgi:hypothetical protein